MNSEQAGLNALDDFFKHFPFYTESERKRITDGWIWMAELTEGKTRTCGEAYMEHPLRAAAILAQLKMDDDAIISALLHNVFALDSTKGDEIEAKFGTPVLKIVTGTSWITSLKINNPSPHQAEVIRKMFFAMIEDIRVILVKLADRLDRMRNLKSLPPDKQKAIAHEVIDIWVPLANRLGISAVKDELEDLSLKFSAPDIYEQIKQIVASKKGEREVYLENARQAITQAAAREGIAVTVNARAKHFWSIYQKMKKRQKGADELYDLLAVRILCESEWECYTLLGLVHKLWKPLDGRIKDYIASPKRNGYSSLHTTVMCEGKPLEIQIRTHEMHHIAEHGVASHWIYKMGTNRDTVSIENLSVVNQLKELRRRRGDDETLFREIKEELLGNSVYVFTPKGDIIELPAGATAIDFAYYIHSAVGEKIVGAKANGHIIPLSQPLKNTQIIEILTSPQARPTINQLQLVKTAKARSKIRSWLLMNDESLIFDKNAAARRRQQTLQQEQAEGQGQKKRPFHGKSGTEPAVFPHTGEPVQIRVGDTANFLIKIAGCCKPEPGDPITGYVSRGRGIIVHRRDCPNLNLIPEITERTIEVIWENTP